MIDHERLDVYRVSISLVAEMWSIIGTLPSGNSEIANKLKRAVLSIPLNIAEGVGKNTSAEKKRFFAIARGSAMECAALVDVMYAIGLTDDSTTEKLKLTTTRVVAMLCGLCRR